MYAQNAGWTFVSREETEKRRGIASIKNEELGIRNGSLFFDDLLDAKVRKFNPRYTEAEGTLLGAFKLLHTNIYGNPPSPKGNGGTGREHKAIERTST